MAKTLIVHIELPDHLDPDTGMDTHDEPLLSLRSLVTRIHGLLENGSDDSPVIPVGVVKGQFTGEKETFEIVPLGRWFSLAWESIDTSVGSEG